MSYEDSAFSTADMGYSRLGRTHSRVQWYRYQRG